VAALERVLERRQLLEGDRPRARDLGCQELVDLDPDNPLLHVVDVLGNDVDCHVERLIAREERRHPIRQDCRGEPPEGVRSGPPAVGLDLGRALLHFVGTRARLGGDGVPASSAEQRHVGRVDALRLEACLAQNLLEHSRAELQVSGIGRGHHQKPLAIDQRVPGEVCLEPPAE